MVNTDKTTTAEQAKSALDAVKESQGELKQKIVLPVGLKCLFASLVGLTSLSTGFSSGSSEWTLAALSSALLLVVLVLFLNWRAKAYGYQAKVNNSVKRVFIAMGAGLSIFLTPVLYSEGYTRLPYVVAACLFILSFWFADMEFGGDGFHQGEKS